MTRSILFMLALIVLNGAGANTARALEQDFTGWYSLTLAGDFSAISPELDDFHWFILDQTRLIQDSSRFSEHLLFVQAGYDLTDEISVWLGYTHNWANPLGRGAIEENRPYQDFLWRHSLDTGIFASRTRLEQRILDPGGDLGWRFRQMFEYTLPLTPDDGLRMILSNEGFFYAGTSSWGEGGFSENRAIVSLAFAVAPRLDLSLGYMNQYVVKSSAENNMNHVLMVTVGLKL